ncbi:hypothetical protein SynA1524_02637 [Synechococcus sp. A15-24]|nr:hypothetical protein SynA1524_02637 [Synechococcus sp. A15-24]
MSLSIRLIDANLIQPSSIKGSRRGTHQQSDADYLGLPHQNSIQFRTDASA